MLKQAALPLPLLLTVCGCWPAGERELVVYTALDREFSEPILNDFAEQSGMQVLASYDVESTKTVGLTNQIIAESSRPRCDLFWNNEILNTLRLEEQGLLEVYRSPRAADIPQQFVSPAGRWHGFAARVRVLAVNTDQLSPEERPRSIHDLTDPKWKGRVGIAKPLFGTTATHAACLFAAWGDEPAKEFFLKLKQNVKVMSGNKQVALAVASGELAFGLTDTDDAYIEQAVKAMPVQIVFPDQEEGQLGALFIPNTLALVKGSPHGERARRLVDYLLSPEVETRLALGQSSQFPLGSRVEARPGVAPARPLRRMEVDFSAAAAKWETAAAFLQEHFAAAD